MLYDGALRFMMAAELGFQEENFARRAEAIHNNIQRTQAIITELQATLNMEAGGGVLGKSLPPLRLHAGSSEPGQPREGCSEDQGRGGVHAGYS